MAGQRATTTYGACFCGRVKFELELPSKWCAHCHCSMCRKIHGAGYVTWIGFPTEALRFSGGEDGVRWYASSPEAQRGSCSTCSSNLFFRSQRWSDEIHVVLAAVDGPVDRRPDANVFYSSHVDWMPIDRTLRTSDPDQA